MQTEDAICPALGNTCGQGRPSSIVPFARLLCAAASSFRRINDLNRSVTGNSSSVARPLHRGSFAVELTTKEENVCHERYPKAAEPLAFTSELC